MAIQNEIESRLKTALREKDQAVLDVLRMLKSRVQEKTTAKGFSGEVTDALWLEVIAAYQKQMKKAAAEYEAGRARRGAIPQDLLRGRILCRVSSDTTR